MLKVKLKDVGRQNILSDEKYAWLMRHLDTPLPIGSLELDAYTGELSYLVVHTADVPDGLIVLFIDSNAVKYELVGALPMKNY